MSSPAARLTFEEPLLASPSKSRAAAATARNWSTVNNWLARRCAPSPVPPFERNDDTLAYLLSLVHANDAADAERDLLHRARTEALAEHEAVSRQSEQTLDPAQELLREIESALSPPAHSSLDALASAAVTLGVLPPHSASSIASAITDLTYSSFAAQQHTQRLTDLQKQLQREIQATQQAIAELKSATEDEAVTTTLRQQTALWTRETKVLTLKAAEYKDRITSLERWSESLTGPLFPDVKELEERVEQRQRSAKTLEDRVLGYHGLPADVEIARAEIRRAQVELGELKGRREALFGRMVER